MSATIHQSYIFGVQEESIIMNISPAECHLKMFQGLQNIKINNWCQAISVSDDEVYITGGLSQSGKVITSDAMLFRPITQQMISLPQMNQVRYVHQSIMKDDRLYILGGRHYGPDFESVLSHCEYLQDGVWKVIAPMSKRRSNFGVFIYNNKIHVIGGFDGRKHTKSIEVYHDDKNVWNKLKTKLPKGLAGMTILSVEPHKIMVIGGITQQGPTSTTHIINLKEGNIIATGPMLESRTLPQIVYDEGRLIAFGGNPKQTYCESFDFDSQSWLPIELAFDKQQIGPIISSGMKGYAVSSRSVWVSNDNVDNEDQQLENADSFGLLIGNDEFPFIMTIPKNMNQNANKIKLLPTPCCLQLQSYMSSCLVENNEQNKLIFVAGGIDCRITQISKKAHLISVDISTGSVRSKPIGKLSYHRYAASCIFKHPFVYMIGGRGYQNDVLSLHSTVERYNMDEEEWEQVAPLNEAKCSTTAAVLNDRVYVFGGYIGDSKISNKIECFNDAFKEWTTLNVLLPFPLEGLSSICLLESDILIVGGKGQDGSRKEVIKYNWKELQDNNNTEGEILGLMDNSRSLPKVLLLDDGKILVFGGQFFDNPEIQFAEILNTDQQPMQDEIENYQIPHQLEKLHHQIGGPDFLGMFTVIQY